MGAKRLNDLTTTDTTEAYKKYKSSIEIVRWGSMKFWFIVFVVLLLSYLAFLSEEYRLNANQVNLLFIWLIFSIWMIANRIWYEDGFKDWYEAGHWDGTRWAVKEINNFTDEDIDMIEEMESMAEAEKPQKKKKR